MRLMPRFCRSVFFVVVAGGLFTALPAIKAYGRPQAVKLSPAQRARAHGELPLTVFYDTSAPLSPGKPGDLIRWQPADEYDVPEGVSAVRIVYRSASATGADVAASGVVLIPRGNAPKEGWPVIAWAHPFIAVARQCAPSLMRGLGSGSVLSMYVNLGYAVVATDYTGLGTAYRNAGYDVDSNALDVIYAVQAARKAVSRLGATWVAVGEGNGGAAALALAEEESATKDQGYLGSVSISGGLDFRGKFDQVRSGKWEDSLAYLAFGMKTVYPAFSLDDMLTKRGMDRYEVVTKACSPPPLQTPLSAPEALKPEWQQNSFVHGFFGRNTLGQKPAGAPVLILSAEDGKKSADAQVVARMCGQNDRIDFETYPNVDPNNLIGTSVAAQMAWIKARFAGTMTQNTCR